MLLYSFNPRSASLTVAKYVIKVLDSELEGSLASKKVVKEQADALLDLFAKSPPQTPDDIQILFASANALGTWDAQIEFLNKQRSQFIAALPNDVEKQLLNTGQ